MTSPPSVSQETRGGPGLLLLLGLVGVAFSAPLPFPETHGAFLGSVVVLLVASLYGVSGGAVASLLATLLVSRASPLPFAGIPFLLEGPLVAWATRKTVPLAYAGCAYWILVGLPLQLALVGHFGRGGESRLWLDATVVLLSGCIAAVLAETLLTLLPLDRWLRTPLVRSTPSLQQRICLALLLSFLAPSVILTGLLVPREILHQRLLLQHRGISPENDPRGHEALAREILDFLGPMAYFLLATLPLAWTASRLLLRPLDRLQGRWEHALPPASGEAPGELADPTLLETASLERILEELWSTRTDPIGEQVADSPYPSEPGSRVPAEDLDHEVMRRQLAEERLRIFHRVFLCNREAMLLLDASGGFLAQNATFRSLFGFEDDELLERSMECFLDGEDQEELSQALEREGTSRLELRGRSRRGMEFPLGVVTYPVPGEPGELPFRLCVLDPTALPGAVPPPEFRPRSTPPRRVASLPPPRPLPTTTTDPEAVHVLVVEDNEINRVLLETILRKLGWSFSLASTGAEAVAATREEDFDLVLMDLHMPDMDGFQAAAAIRERETGTHVPILAVTADVSPGTRERCLEVGMDDYLSKPIEVEAFSRKLRELMRRDRPAA